ncbi:hypothetical protein ACIP25_11790 [Streptomyces massasporeus]|uniref:hypothetical protein n=1 Tax=Streptomyces massasporeus TaxID=67324 RepID=UPI0037F33F25
MNPARYHLTLTSEGRPAMQGWWGSEAVARGKVTTWIRHWGRPGARITLVDEDAGAVLTTWPDEV